jgi:hypothetical protein
MDEETLKEAAENRYGTDMDSIRGSNVYDLNSDLKRGFIEGATWQAERMFSEEQVKNLMKNACEKGMQIQSSINDVIIIPHFRIKAYVEETVCNIKNSR